MTPMLTWPFETAKYVEDDDAESSSIKQVGRGSTKKSKTISMPCQRQHMPITVRINERGVTDEPSR